MVCCNGRVFFLLTQTNLNIGEKTPAPSACVSTGAGEVRVIWTDREKLFPAPDLEIWVQPSSETEWKLVAMEPGQRTLTTKLPWSQLSGAVRAKAWLDAPAVPKGLEVKTVHKAWVARPGERELSVAPGHAVKLVHTDERWAYVLATQPPSKTAGEEVPPTDRKGHWQEHRWANVSLSEAVSDCNETSGTVFSR